MKKLIPLAGAAAVMLMASAALAAGTATTTTATTWYAPSVNQLHSGPDATFPVVASVPANAQMTVYGCLQNWSWCDVAWNDQRGWLPGSSIQTVYQSKPAYITEVAPAMNVPVETYSTATYWDTHYQSAPFYTQRERYVSWVYKP
jgi:uncharacterized protein YraI